MSSILLLAAFGLLFAGLSQLGILAMLAAIVCFGAIVFFQLVNLPVEFNASSRAKNELVGLGIVLAK